jgi:hypothetical protein
LVPETAVSSGKNLENLAEFAQVVVLSAVTGGDFHGWAGWGTTVIKGRRRSKLAVEELSEKPPGVVEPVGTLAGQTTGLLCCASARAPGQIKGDVLGFL